MAIEQQLLNLADEELQQAPLILANFVGVHVDGVPLDQLIDFVEENENPPEEEMLPQNVNLPTNVNLPENGMLPEDDNLPEDVNLPADLLEDQVVPPE